MAMRGVTKNGNDLKSGQTILVP